MIQTEDNCERHVSGECPTEAHAVGCYKCPLWVHRKAPLKIKARLCLSDGKIECCTQMCESSEDCFRFNECEEVEVEVRFPEGGEKDEPSKGR